MRACCSSNVFNKRRGLVTALLCLKPNAGRPSSNLPGALFSQTWANLAPDAYRTPNGTWPFRVSATVPPASSTPAERGYNFVQVRRAGCGDGVAG